VNATANTPGADDVVIEAHGLSRVYGRGKAATRAVDGVALSVKAGEVVLIFGPSGCGKSTLLALLGGLDRDYTGTLRLFGQDTRRLGDAALSRLRGRRIGFVFQAFHLLPHLKVLDNVAAPSLFADALTAAEARRHALSLLDRVGLADRAAAHPTELSGGQRQRVAIARALFHDPRLLLCDEPTGNLDQRTGAQIIELFAKVHQDLGTTIVVVTHEDRLATLAHRKLFMTDGRVESDGEAP